MAKRTNIKIEFRRKRKGKTDYRRRLKLLKSRKPRLVVRKTNKHIIAQIIRYSPEGDRVVVGLNSAMLSKLGWGFSKKNIPAAYLTGLMLGKKAAAEKIDEAVADFGLLSTVKGSRIFAVIKGAQDAGLKLNADDGISPKKERLEGKHVAEHYSKNPALFSKYRAEGLKPEDMGMMFNNVKIKIIGEKQQK